MLPADSPTRPRHTTSALRRVAVLVRHNATLLARDPHHLVAYAVMPMVLMAVLRPLYTAALDQPGLPGGAAGTTQAAAGMTCCSPCSR